MHTLKNNSSASGFDRLQPTYTETARPGRVFRRNVSQAFFFPQHRAILYQNTVLSALPGCVLRGQQRNFVSQRTSIYNSSLCPDVSSER